MSESNEVYVLCGARSAQLAQKFLDVFLPCRKPLSFDYPYPQYSDYPTIVFENPVDVMNRLESDLTERYSLYWGELDIKTHTQSMLFFTNDGGMIAGVATYDSDLVNVLRRLSDLVGGRFGYLSFESPPPHTCHEFIAMCRVTDSPALVDGRIREETQSSS